MTDGPERSAPIRRQREHREGGAVTSLANQALSVLATRRVRRDGSTYATMIRKLEAAVLDRDPSKRVAVLAELRALQVPDAQIAEEVIPEIARRLGDAWCEDNMSFADVTIGSARLQAMVRDLAPREVEPSDTEVPLIGIVVPGDEHHTLGAMVATSKLRRLGLAVRVFLGKDSDDVAGELASDRFDAVFVSVSSGEEVVKLTGLIKKIRQSVTQATPIVLGGSAVARGFEAEGHIGADYVTSDIDGALEACGLKTFHKDAGRPTATAKTISRSS